MKRFLLSLFFLVVGFVGGVVCWRTDYATNWSGIRDNGMTWFRFGPAVISDSNCSEIVIRFADAPDDIVVTDLIKIGAIKAWMLQNNIYSRFDFAPLRPDKTKNNIRYMETRVALYASIGKNGLIVSAPISTLSLGVTQDECSHKIEQLKMLVQPK